MFDEKEFNRIFYKYKDRIYKYCYARLSKDKFAAEEVLDDVFDLLFKKWDTLEIGDNIGAYLYRTADILVKKKLRENFEYYSHNEAFDAETAEKTGQVGIHNDKYFNEEPPDIEVSIERIKQSLNEEDRRLFIYRYIEKKTLMEITEITKIPYSSIKYRLMKIDKAVKKEIIKIFR